MDQKFKIGQIVTKNNKLFKIKKIIEFFVKENGYRFEYYYHPINNTNQLLKSIGYDLEHI